jgi:iron complex transport system substrate-binding protein
MRNRLVRFAPLLLTCLCLSAAAGAQGRAARSVVDMAGRTVALPEKVERVACISGPSYEKVFLLGAGRKIAAKNPGASSGGWAAATNPGHKDIAVIQNPKDPNIEELLKAKVDVVFYWDYPEPLAKLEKAGLTVVVTQVATGNPSSAAEFVEFQKREVRLFGDVLGGEAASKAARWCAELDERVARIAGRTAKAKSRPSVYFIGGGSPLSVFSRNSYPQWWIEMAGGSLVSGNTPTEMNATVSMEEVLKWNPEYVFMGRLASTAPVVEAPAWEPVRAVIEKKVFLVPDGIMFWDYGSEGMLLLSYLASKLHPELFPDIDMAAEVKDYYRSYYGFALSDDQAARILSHRAPAP